MDIQGLDPLKNALAALCRAIRAHNPHSHIFITNNLALPWCAPVLKARTGAHNDLLFKAVTGINIKLGRVFFMGIQEHMTGAEPESLYFKGDALSYMGCMTYRSCVSGGGCRTLPHLEIVDCTGT